MMNNFFFAIKRLCLGNNHEANPSNICFTPQTEGEKHLAPAFGKIQRLCTHIPGSRFCIEVEEGRIVVAMNWTPRTNKEKHLGKHRFVIDATGESEMEKSKESSDTQLIVNSEPLKERRTTQAEEAPSKTPGLIRRVADYLTSRYYFRFNVLTEQTEYAERTISAERTEEDPNHLIYIYQKVDKRALNTLALDALEAGVECWDRDVQRFVNSKRIAVYHPFTNYMEELPTWDGKDRVTELATRVSNNPVWQQGFHRWMLGLTAQWMKFDMGNRANSVAPLLVSNEQGWGKSTFCRSLMPKELADYYTDSFDLNAPAACEQKLAAFGLINMDEFDRLSASKMPLLKNLMQMPALNIRRLIIKATNRCTV